MSSGAVVNEAQDLIWNPASGSVLVTSAADNRVMEFDADGVYLGDLVASGSGGLAHPTGLVLAPGGTTLLVASQDTSSVLSYDARARRREIAELAGSPRRAILRENDR